MIEQITRWPVLIVSNYRSGSTALLGSLENNPVYSVYGEPRIIPGAIRTDKFLQKYHKGEKNYIVKTIIDQIPDMPELQYLLNSDCFKIRLIRDNLVDQVTSYYVSLKTEVWNIESEIDNLSRTVEIDDRIIHFAIETICKNEIDLRNLNIKFDLELVYEDLGTMYNIATGQLKFIRLIPPENINEIKKHIRNLMLEKCSK